MANPDHVKILVRGIEHWNQWREENPDIEPDLSGEDFKFVDLGLASVTSLEQFATPDEEPPIEPEAGPDGYPVTLVRANFSAANLAHTEFRFSNLSHAIFSFANLEGTALIDSDLAFADLADARLSGEKVPGTRVFVFSC